MKEAFIMGKASRWFKELLGFKKSELDPKTIKNKWSFTKSLKDKHGPDSQRGGVRVEIENDPSLHALSVAAATASVAKASVAASHAAAVVVQLSSSSGRDCSKVGGCSAVRSAAHVNRSWSGYGSQKERAAVIIQSHFRAYLSRRALRALKALVKIQALTRGHLVRKQTADVLRRMQALVRAQARARAVRALIYDSPFSSTKSSHFNYQGLATPEQFKHVIRPNSAKHGQTTMLKRTGSKSRDSTPFDPERLQANSSWIDGRMSERSGEQGLSVRNGYVDEERGDKILEVDTGKPYITPISKTVLHTPHCSMVLDKNRLSNSTSKEFFAHQTFTCSSYGEIQPLSPLKLALDDDGSAFCIADSSPQLYSTSSIGGNSKRVVTPAKSDGSRSCQSVYSDNPNYMSYTESSKAKARSHSTPKQRLQYERSASIKRYTMHGSTESKSHNQRVSALHANFTNKAYPGSGRLDRLGMPVRDVTGFSEGHW